MILYFMPQYIDGVGDRIVVEYTGTKDIVNKNVRNMLKSIAENYGQDIREIKYKCSKITNLGKLTPIAFSTDEVLMPIKVRKPRVHRDAGYGYINIFCVEHIKDNYILLNNGTKIFFIENKRSIIKRFNLAKNLCKGIIDIEYKNINRNLNEVLKLNEKLATIIYNTKVDF